MESIQKTLWAQERLSHNTATPMNPGGLGKICMVGFIWTGQQKYRI